MTLRSPEGSALNGVSGPPHPGLREGSKDLESLGRREAAMLGSSHEALVLERGQQGVIVGMHCGGRSRQWTPWPPPAP